MVLARLPDAPEGVKGISLFIVPKFLVNDDGTLGKRNDVTCISLEHHGLAYMFTMMNQARHAVGVEGYGIAERAYQKAVSYARERKQGKTLLGVQQCLIRPSIMVIRQRVSVCNGAENC